MKMFKRIMLAALSLCMALGIVGLVAACGKSKAKKIDYTVTVTCTETEALANVKAGLTTAEGEAVEGGEAKALTDGTATFTVLPGTYQVVLTGVPETYEYQPATLTETTTTATITLTQKTPVGPQEPTIDAKYNGTWSNADHTVVVDAANGTITLDGTQATDIAEDETAGYTFQCGGKTWSLFFTIEDPDTLCLDDGEDDFSELTAGTYVPPTPATMPSDFPAKWYDEDETEAIVFDGANFTYMDEEGVVTAVTDNKDGTYTITATYMEDEISFTWTKADFTLSLTVYDTLVTYYAEGHVPFHIDGAFDGTWTSFDGETTIVIDAEGATITIGEDAATGIALAADGSYTFTWNGESCSIYFVDDDYTTLHFKYGTMDPVKFRQGIMPPAFPATWYDETGEVALTFEGATFTYSDGEGVVTEATETENNWDFQGTYTFEGMDPFTFTAEWAVEEGTLTLHIDMGDDAEPQTAVFYATPQGGDVGGGDKVDIPDSLNGTYQDEAKTYTVVVDATNDTITINDVEVTNLAEADFGYDFDWNGKSWNFWGLAGSFTLDGTGDNAAVSISLYLVEDENTVDVAEEFDGKWYDEKYFTEGVDASEILLDVSAANDTISINGSNVKELATDEATGGYTFTFDNAQYKLYFTGEDHTTLYLAKGEAAPTALHKKDWKPTEPEVTLPADFPTLWESKDHGEVLTFDGAAFTYTADNEELKGTVTAVTDNQDGTYTLTATYNGGYELTLTYDSSAQKSLKLAGYGWEYATELQVRLPNQIDAAYAGTWSNKTYTVVVDTEKGTISITTEGNTDEMTEIKAAEKGYTFSWKGLACSLYFEEGDSAHETITFKKGEEILTLQKGEFVAPEIDLPEDMPLEWEIDMGEGAMGSFVLDEKGHFSGILGDGFFTDKTQKEDGNWYFNAEISGGDPCVIVWETEKNLLHMTSDGDFVPSDENDVYTFTPKAPLQLPEGLDGTYYDGMGSEIIITITGKDVSMVSFAGTDYEDVTAYTITDCTDNSITLTSEEGDTLSCTFDVQAGTFSLLDPSGRRDPTVYYKTLPHATSYLEGFTTYTWSSNEDGEEHLLTFQKESCDFTFDGKDGYLYRVDEDSAMLYGFCDGAFLSFEWNETEEVLLRYLDPFGMSTVEFHPVKEAFDPTAFLALGLDGTWYGDSYAGYFTQAPIYLNFTKDSLEVKFALNGQTPATGTVTAYDEATKTITAVIVDTYYFVYDPETDRMTDGNPEGADSTKNYGPYIHYTYDFNSTAIQAPAWFGYTFAAAETTLSIKENNLVVNGASQNRIRHYDAEKKELIVLFEGAHVFVTYDDGTNTLIATPLKEDAYGTISGTFYKVPDPLNPNLTWLDENTWESESGGSISFEGANVTVNATGINNWKGFITAHEAEKKTLTVYFIGHGSVTITYTEDTVRTLTCTLGGKSFTFTQTVILTLPEAINGKWVGKDDWKSVTIENGKMTVESGRYDKGPYDITNVANEGNIWTFNVNVASSEQNFTYDEEKDTLTVAIYNGVVNFTRYEEPKEGLPAELQNTTWKGVNDAKGSYFNVEFGTTLTIKYGSDTTNADVAATKEVEVTIDTEKSKDGVWVFSFSEGDLFKTTYTFTYTTEGDKLEMMKGTVHFNFTKQGGGDVVDTSKLPAELYGTWNGQSADTSPSYFNVTFDETLTAKTSLSKDQAPNKDSTISDIVYKDGVWTFTVAIPSFIGATNYYFTYDASTKTLTAKMGTSKNYTFTKAE